MLQVTSLWSPHVRRRHRGHIRPRRARILVTAEGNPGYTDPEPGVSQSPVQEKNMRMRLSAFGGLCLVALLGLVLAFQLSAQNKKTKPPKMSNIQGSVQTLDKAKMTITVRSGNVRKDVIYSGDTKFMYGHSNDNKPGSIDQVKDNFYISCAGTYEAGKVQLMAKECVYRERKLP